MRIAVPRALHAYDLFPHWKAFLEALGHEVLRTPPTDRATLDDGIRACLSDICLPLKAYMGHLARAAALGDAVFVPRLVSLDPARYSCPKFLALPDLARVKAPGVRLLTPEINAKKGPDFTRRSFVALARALGASASEGADAFAAAQDAQHAHDLAALARFPRGGNRRRVALLGHPYVVEDDQISSGVKQWLEGQDVAVVTRDMVPLETLERVDPGLFRDVYWEGPWAQTRAAVHFLERSDLDGMIFLSAFGCGPDSFTGDIVGRRARASGHFPFARILVDEHTAREGLLTRLEAFLDMLGKRKAL